MKKLLVIIDMQKDFVYGVLGTKEAQGIIGNIERKASEYSQRDDYLLFTRDTHFTNYLETSEGKYLPVPHCIYRTDGWNIIDELTPYVEQKDANVVNKLYFGYSDWRNVWVDMDIDTTEIELVGVCTDICIVSNALILKSIFPNINISVDASCCAGVTPELHKKALDVMKQCQINVIGE